MDSYVDLLKSDTYESIALRRETIGSLLLTCASPAEMRWVLRKFLDAVTEWIDRMQYHFNIVCYTLPNVIGPDGEPQWYSWIVQSTQAERMLVKRGNVTVLKLLIHLSSLLEKSDSERAETWVSYTKALCEGVEGL